MTRRDLETIAFAKLDTAAVEQDAWAETFWRGVAWACARIDPTYEYLEGRNEQCARRYGYDGS